MRDTEDVKVLDHLVSSQDIFICNSFLFVALHLLRPSLHQVIDVVVALQKLLVARTPVTVVVLPRLSFCNKLRHTTAEALVNLPREATVLLPQSGILLSECQIVGLKLGNLVAQPLFLAVVLGRAVARLIDAATESLVLDGEGGDLLLETGNDNQGEALSLSLGCGLEAVVFIHHRLIDLFELALLLHEGVPFVKADFDVVNLANSVVASSVRTRSLDGHKLLSPLRCGFDKPPLGHRVVVVGSFALVVLQCWFQRSSIK